MAAVPGRIRRASRMDERKKLKESPLLRSRYMFVDGEEVIDCANNQMMGAWVEDPTYDCVIVTSYALARIQNGKLNLRIDKENVLGVWMTRQSTVSRPQLHVGLTDGRTRKIEIRLLDDCKRIGGIVYRWGKDNYVPRYRTAKKHREVSVTKIRMEGADLGFMIPGAVVWKDREYVFSQVPDVMSAGVHLRLPHRAFRRGHVPVVEVDEPAALFVIFELPGTSLTSRGDDDNRSGGFGTSLPRKGWQKLAGKAPKILGPKYGDKQQVVYFKVVEPGKISLPKIATTDTCASIVAKFGLNGAPPPKPEAAVKEEKARSKEHGYKSSSVEAENTKKSPTQESSLVVINDSDAKRQASSSSSSSSSSSHPTTIGGEPPPSRSGSGEQGRQQVSSEQKSSEKDGGGEMVAKQAAAAIGMSKPKHLGDGIVSGLKTTGTGVLLGLGYLCYAPYAGAKEDGIKGFGVGLAKGVAGVVAAPVVGTLMGVGQILRGAVNTPGAVSAGIEGKIWDPKSEEWVTPTPYNLMENYYQILDRKEEEEKAANEGDGGRLLGSRKVKETKLYEVLGVNTNATQKQIRKAYYKEALKSHPDKNPDNPEAKTRFQLLSKAYQVLSNPQLRADYDRFGESAAEGVRFDVVSATAVFFTALFGSEHFEPFVGEFALGSRLSKVLSGVDMEGDGEGGASGAAAAAASSSAELLGDEADERAQQERQVKCAVNTLALIEPYVNGEKEGFQRSIREVTARLVNAPFGAKLVRAMGHAYQIAADMYLGYETSFMGVKGTVAATLKSARKMKKSISLATEGFHAVRAASRIATSADAGHAMSLKDPAVDAKVVSVEGPRITRIVKLESQDNMYTELQMDGMVEKMSVVKALSGANSSSSINSSNSKSNSSSSSSSSSSGRRDGIVFEEGKNYGFHKRAIWCDQGVRGIFRVVVNRDPAAATDKKEDFSTPITGEKDAAANEYKQSGGNKNDSASAETSNAGGGGEEMTPARARASQRELEKSLPVFLKAMWAFTELDVNDTIHGVCKKLFSDVGVDSVTRRERAKGIKELAKILLEAKASGTDKESKAAQGQFSGEDAKGHFMNALQFALMKTTQENKDDST